MATKQEIIIELEKYRAKKTRNNQRMSRELASICVEYINKTVDNRYKSKKLPRVLVELTVTKQNTEPYKVYERLCNNAEVVPNQSVLKGFNKYKIKPKQPNQINRTYINPEIQRHLDIANALIAEEDTKLAIYNEMKALLEV